jgi:hypothetical protein
MAIPISKEGLSVVTNKRNRGRSKRSASSPLKNAGKTSKSATTPSNMGSDDFFSLSMGCALCVSVRRLGTAVNRSWLCFGPLRLCRSLGGLFR